MKKGMGAVILFLLLTSFLYSQRSLFVGTIPLNGRIPLQETFSLELTATSTLLFSQEMAGTEIQVATYSFSSNSPEVQYQMRLSPGIDSSLGHGVFAFRNITEEGFDTGGYPIPFSLILKDSTEGASVEGDQYRSVQKPIGAMIGSRFQETGSIHVAFPSQSQGFNMEDFSSGNYEASVLVEVLAD